MYPACTAAAAVELEPESEAQADVADFGVHSNLEGIVGGANGDDGPASSEVSLPPWGKHDDDYTTSDSEVR